MLSFHDNFDNYFYAETNNWRWTKTTKTFFSKNMSLIAEILKSTLQPAFIMPAHR